MTRTRDADPALKPIRSLAELSQEAGSLATRIALFADTLGRDRNVALLTVNESLANTEMAEEWPLGRYSLRALFKDKTSNVLDRGQPDTENYVSMAGLDYRKYHADTLAHVYPESDSPRIDFARDLIRWVEEMEMRARHLLLAVDLGEDRVEVEVCEDLEIVREHYKSKASKASRDPKLEDGAPAYAWVGDRAIVRASVDEIEALRQLTQPNSL